MVDSDKQAESRAAGKTSPFKSSNLFKWSLKWKWKDKMDQLWKRLLLWQYDEKTETSLLSISWPFHLHGLSHERQQGLNCHGSFSSHDNHVGGDRSWGSTILSGQLSDRRFWITCRPADTTAWGDVFDKGHPNSLVSCSESRGKKSTAATDDTPN